MRYMKQDQKVYVCVGGGRNHFLNRLPVSLERLSWQSHLFRQKRHQHCLPGSISPEPPIYPLPLDKHMHTPISAIE